VSLINQNENLAAIRNKLPSEKFILKNKAKKFTSVSLLYFKESYFQLTQDESENADIKKN
jgi:hypothetical protein